jgi:dextranase
MAPLSVKLSGLTATPDCGTYAPGQDVKISLFVQSTGASKADVELNIFRGLDMVNFQHKVWTLSEGNNRLDCSFQSSATAPAGYGVEVTVKTQNVEQVLLCCETAFDVLSDWTEFPRYGFVCDFKPERNNAEDTIKTLTRFHLNGLQFYDWQYRHDSLVPPQDDFLDPLGRPLSLSVTRELITSAHKHGMKAMPYLAIYAASAAFWHAHPEMTLYDEKHQLIPFGEEFLGIMNPAANGAWSKHLLAECKHVLDVLPFDGLHIDQYGDPKTGFDENGQAVDLPEAFADFIRVAVQQHPGVAVLFNAVGNWPIDSLAHAPVSFNYIEIWPPKTSYTDVAEIVRNARHLSDDKPVVIALYLPANRPINNRLADAVIFSAGGTRIELGENGRLLSDPYFPKHEAMDPALSEALRRQLELVIRYQDWISPIVVEESAPQIKGPEGIEYYFRKTGEGFSLSLVNLASPEPLQWNEEHAAPKALTSFEVELSIAKQIKNIWLVSPDLNSLNPVPLEFDQTSQKLKVEIPSLEIWDVLLIETNS